MSEYQRELKLENERYRELLDLVKVIVAGIVAVLMILIVAGVLLLGAHTGPRVCDDCGTSCVRQGPTHLELLIGE